MDLVFAIAGRDSERPHTKAAALRSLVFAKARDFEHEKTGMRRALVSDMANANATWTAMQEYSHGRLCESFAEKHALSLDAAKQVFREMKRFLFVSMIADEPCSPSRIVDEMWHEFVLHTVDYREFCDEFHGGFIDHTPSPVPEVAGYIRTKALAEMIFGTLDELCWPEPSNAALIGKCSCTNKGCTCNCSNNVRMARGLANGA